MIRAIVFDMDGVLIDAREWHYEAFNRAVSLFGFGVTQAEHESMFDGLPTRHKLEMLTRIRGLPAELHSFITELKQAYTMEIAAVRCRPSFGQEYALSRLRREGYRLAVASNSIRSTVETMLTMADLYSYLDFCISNEDVKASKPDPEMYNLAISKLGLSPNQCLIVEDNENGIRAARASGAHVMIVEGVADVTYGNVMTRIKELSREPASARGR